MDKLERYRGLQNKMVDGLEGYSFSDRLRILSLTTLETRFLRKDMIEMIEMFREDLRNENVDLVRFFHFVGEDGRRGHCSELLKKRYKLAMTYLPLGQTGYMTKSTMLFGQTMYNFVFCFIKQF